MLPGDLCFSIAKPDIVLRYFPLSLPVPATLRIPLWIPASLLLRWLPPSTPTLKVVASVFLYLNRSYNVYYTKGKRNSVRPKKDRDIIDLTLRKTVASPAKSKTHEFKISCLSTETRKNKMLRIAQLYFFSVLQCQLFFHLSYCLRKQNVK